MRKSSIITAVLVVIALVIALQYFLDDDGNPSITPTPTPTNGMKKGFGLSPYDYSSEGFNDFLAKTKLSGGVITWSGDWTQLSDKKSGPSVVARLAKSQGLESIIIAQFFTQFTRQPIRTLNESTLKSYKDSAVNFTRANKPRYIGFGIEVNVISSSPDYLKFKAFFSELKTAIKAVSAETKVFTVFQLEMMKGLNGGLFGGVNDPMNAQWYLINDFQMDCVAFTTYPCLV